MGYSLINENSPWHNQVSNYDYLLTVGSDCELVAWVGDLGQDAHK